MRLGKIINFAVLFDHLTGLCSTDTHIWCVHFCYFCFERERKILLICRTVAADSNLTEQFNRMAAEYREPCKELLVTVLRKALGNDSLHDDFVNHLLHKSDILKGLMSMLISIGNNDKEGQVSAVYNLLNRLANAR